MDAKDFIVAAIIIMFVLIPFEVYCTIIGFREGGLAIFYIFVALEVCAIGCNFSEKCLKFWANQD